MTDTGARAAVRAPDERPDVRNLLHHAARRPGSRAHRGHHRAGDAVVDEVEGLVPGLERDLVVTLEPGEYTFMCKLADHEARGMKGTLTVTA